MTLVVSRVSPRYAVQVADRRLIYTDGREADPMANKNLLYFAADGIVTMGYTGIATVSGTPTDRWIAERIVGQKLRGSGIGGTQLLHWPDVGHALRLIGTALEPLLNRAKIKSFDLVAAGWQWRGRLLVPRIWSLTHSDGVGRVEYTATRWFKHFPRSTTWCVAPGSNVRNRKLLLEMRDLADRQRDPQAATGYIVDTIRTVSRANAAVGPHCMTVLIPNPLISREIDIRYMPLGEQFAGIRSGTVETKVPSAFTPWIISPGIIAAPSVIVGSWELRVGDFRVNLHAPESDRFLAAFSSQKRR